MSNEGEETTIPMSKEQVIHAKRLGDISDVLTDRHDALDMLESEISGTYTQLNYLDDKHRQFKKETDDRLQLLRDTIRINQLANTIDYYRIDLDLVQVKRNWNLVVSSVWSIITTIIYLVLIIMIKESILTGPTNMKPLAITFGVIALCALALIYITYKRRDTVLKYEAEQDFKYLEKAENKMKQLSKKAI